MKTVASEFDIVLRVTPELAWLRLVGSTVRSYLKARNYPSRLVNAMIAAVGEVTEQLVSLCIDLGKTAPFEVGFLWQDGVVQVHLVYDGSVPLNPHKETDYEVPSSVEDMDETLEGLWLHIVKQTMDRVFFRLNGERASLVLMKYYREEEHVQRLWFMGLKPALRTDLYIERPPQTAAGSQPGGAIIRDKLKRSAFNLTPSDEFIVSRLNGKNSLHDIYLEHTVSRGLISPQSVRRLYERLEAGGMLEGSLAADELRRLAWQRWLSPVFSIPHPDEVITWLHRYTRFMFNSVAVSLLVLVGFSGLIALFVNRQAIGAMLPRMDSLFSDPTMVAVVYLIMLGHVALHELAHGVTCKHFGGRVGQLGVMWYMAMSVFFCDTTSAWTFAKKSQRIWVSLAGPLVSWASFGIIAWLATVSTAEGNPWAVMWIALTLMTGGGLAMNFNPFIRMDGYYMLVDWTGIPNLQKKAWDYMKANIIARMKRSRNAEKPSLSSLSGRERQILLAYGVLSVTMSFFLILLPFWQLARLWMANRHVTFWGIMTAGAVALVIGRIIYKAHSLMYAVRHREYTLS